MSDLIKNLLEVLIAQFGRDAVRKGLKATETFVPDQSYILDRVVESLCRWYRRTTPDEERLSDDLKKDIAQRMRKYQDGLCLAHYITQEYLGHDYKRAKDFVTENWERIVNLTVKFL